MDNRKKIVILANNLKYGSLSTSIVTKAHMLIDYYDVEIVILYKKDFVIPYTLDNRIKVTFLKNEITNDKVHTNFIMKRINDKKKYNMDKNLISNYLSSYKSDLIITTEFNIAFILNELIPTTKIIYEEHDFDNTKRHIKALNKLDNIDYIMPVSEYMYKEYSALVKNNVKYKFIPLPLNIYPKEEEYSKLNNYNLISIGELEKSSGYEELISVMDILVNNDKRISLTIFGTGSLNHSLNDLIAEKKLTNNIKIIETNDFNYIKNNISNYSLYVMSAYDEPYGLTILKVLSYGIPCIIFDSAKGCIDIINKSNSIIISNRDINIMAKEIFNYFNSSIEERKLLGASAVSVSKNYNVNNILKLWLEFLGSILN